MLSDMSILSMPRCAAAAVFVAAAAISAHAGMSIDIRLPENPSELEDRAARALAKYAVHAKNVSFASVSQSGKGSDPCALPKDYTVYFKRSTTAPKLTPGTGNAQSCEPIELRLSESCAEIMYPSQFSAGTAAGEFLRRCLGVDVLAPLPLGAAVGEPDLRPGTSIIFKPSHAGRFLGLYQDGAADYAILNAEQPQYFGPNHNMLNIIDAEVAGKHPEWLAMRNGRRGTYKDSPQMQVDFLNPRLPEFVAKKAEEAFAENPEAAVFSISAADSSLFDNSPAFQKLTRKPTHYGYADYGNPIWKFTNAVARKTAQKFPDRFVLNLAYMHSENPPDFPVEPNAALYLALDAGGNFSQSMRNKGEELMRKWSESGAGLFGLYEYNYGGNYFIPRDITRHCARAIKAFHNLGARIYACETFPNWAYDAHKIWIISRLLKDASLDPEELEEEFFLKYYAGSAKGAREFFRIAQKAWDRRSAPVNWLQLYRRDSQAEVFSEGDLEAMQSALAEAEESADSDIVRARVGELSLMFGVTKALVRSYFREKSLWELDAKKLEPKKILDEIDALRISKISKKVALNAYERNTKFPKADLSIWRIWDHSDYSNVLIEDMLNSGRASADDVERARNICPEDVFDAFSKLAKSKNILKNSGFENGLEGWIIYKSEASQEKLSPAEGEGISSGNALEISSINGAGISQRAPASPGASYALELHIRATLRPGNLCYARMLFCDKNGRILDSKYISAPAANFGDYKKMRIVAKAPENSVRIVVSFFCLGMHPTASVFVDDFKLMEGS